MTMRGAIDTPIYLDYNATTPVAAEVREAMLPYLSEHFGNPSSAHAYGRRARDAVEIARAQVAGLIGASADEIVFTTGGTEASNLAIRGAIMARPDLRHIVTTAFEHPATEATCSSLERNGILVSRVPVASDGRVRPEEFLAAVRKNTGLVTLIHAHNELGTLQPVAEISRRVRERGCLMHADAAQSVGKIPVDVRALGVDLLSIAGHKLYAPKGVGALYVRSGVQLASVTTGASQERGLHPGTENVAGIVGLGVAAELVSRDLVARGNRLSELCGQLLNGLRAAILDLVLHGHPSERLPNTLFVTIPGMNGGELLASIPEIAASTGSACHSGSAAPSAALVAMGVPGERAVGPIRFSLGRGTTVPEVDRAVMLVATTYERLRQPRSIKSCSQ
jgi:cysteine desulfurase